MWKIVFTALVSLTLAVILGYIALHYYHENSRLSAILAGVDIAVVFTAAKALLDFTKVSNELRKLRLEISKLELEIDEKNRALASLDSRIVLPSKEEITRYTERHYYQRPSSGFFPIFSLAAAIGFAILVFLSSDPSTQPRRRPLFTDTRAIREQLIKHVWTILISPHDGPPLFFRASFSDHLVTIHADFGADLEGHWDFSETATLTFTTVFITYSDKAEQQERLRGFSLWQLGTVELHATSDARFDGIVRTGGSDDYIAISMWHTN
jgi:hypothetical protein